MACKIGMIIALPSEATRITGMSGWRKDGTETLRCQHLPGDMDLLIGLSGVGIENARRTAEWLLARGVVALINVGVSGALAPHLGPGALIIAKCTLWVDLNGMKVLGTWHAEPEIVVQAADRLASAHIPVHSGRIITSARPILSAAMKEEYGLAFASLAVDTESAGIVLAAQESSCPFFILRAVCDPLTQSVPSWLFDSLEEDGSIRLPKLLGQLVLRPAAIVDLLRLQGQFRQACKSLARAWTFLRYSGFLAAVATTRLPR